MERAGINLLQDEKVKKPPSQSRNGGKSLPERYISTSRRPAEPSVHRRPAYHAFCDRTNDFWRSMTEFYTSLEQRGFIRQKCRDEKYKLGLRLTEEE